MIKGLTTVLLALNLFAFVLMGVDKRLAVRGKWRVPEKTLLGVCALFGALGGYMGMQVFRHKTRHTKFTVGVPLLLIVQAVLLGCFLHIVK